MSQIRTCLDNIARIDAHGHRQLAANARATLDALRRWHSVGYPTGGGGSRAGGVSDSTGSAVANLHRDAVSAWLNLHCDAVGVIAKALDDVASASAWARPTSKDDAERYFRENRPTAICGNSECGKLVTRIGEDRLKAGLCPACYMAQRRSVESA